MKQSQALVKKQQVEQVDRQHNFAMVRVLRLARALLVHVVVTSSWLQEAGAVFSVLRPVEHGAMAKLFWKNERNLRPGQNDELRLYIVQAQHTILKAAMPTSRKLSCRTSPFRDLRPTGSTSLP